MSGFRITRAAGFHITFENGWTASVQFGAGNYADNYNARFDAEDSAGARGSTTAEVAAWDADDNWHQFDDGNTVAGHLTPAEVLAFLNQIAAKENRQ